MELGITAESGTNWLLVGLEAAGFDKIVVLCFTMDALII